VGLSGRSAASALGISEGALRKAVKVGRATRLPDGTFDLEILRKELKASTDPARTRVRTPLDGAHGGALRSTSTEADVQDAVSLVRRVLHEEGVADDGAIDFGKARFVETILKSQERELKMAQRRKELVPIAAVKSHVEKAFIGLRQAIQRLPSRHVAAIAADIGCDPGKLEAALSKAIAAELDVLSSPVVGA
jgi:hypothetical protein